MMSFVIFIMARSQKLIEIADSRWPQRLTKEEIWKIRWKFYLGDRSKSLVTTNPVIKIKSKTRRTLVCLYEHTASPAIRARATLWQGAF